MAKKFQKILISTIIFAITVVNYGLPLHSIASEGQKLFKFNFFHKEEVELNAYFDEDLDNTEKILNVNDTERLTVEINPLIEGYLKEGTLEVNLKNGHENNFRIKSVTTEEQEKAKEELFNSVVKFEETKEESKETSEKVEEPKEEKATSEEKTEKEDKSENAKSEATKNMGSSIFDAAKNLFIDSSIAPEEEKTENKTETNTTTLSSEIIGTVENKEEKATENTNTVEETVKEDKEVASEETVLESESQVLEVKAEELYEVKLKNENEIEIKNVIEDTRLFIDFEYKQNEKLNVEDLYSEIIVSLEGNYINEDLEIIEIIQEKEVTFGWEYTQDVTASANFTKVSPFTIGENFGTIIESVVTVKREINDVKSLPIKQSNIKIEIPKINDKLPKEISVSASKMMATLGKENVSTKTIKNYCTYDGENGVLEINVNNSKLVLGSGEDKFNIICRYEDYYEEEKIKLNQNVEVMVEEYSTNTNVVQELGIKEEQEVTVKSGELVSYFVSDTEEKINKGKINANYYLENKYETEFSNVINFNILTSDVLEEILLQPSTDVYKDGEGNEFDAAQDVKYKGVKFRTDEIQEMLEKGSTIDLLDGEGNVFHTISKENSICAILFSEKIDDVKVRINGLHTNGTIKVEFVKAIETSLYPVEQFKEFKKIVSSVDVSVKYAGLEESFALQKINIERNFSESYTKANIYMDRNYLSSIEKNENVEFKIELNNNTSESDLYKNPTFEVVFPTYIKDVTINNISMLYKNGLSIKEYKVFNEDGVCKVQVVLEGTQEGFDFAEITNGTKLIINVDLILDESTPLKKDEIELYYHNETVTRYQSQTAGVISEENSTEVLNTTVGYDLTSFEYQVPTGMVAVNGISNFDDSGKTIKSIKQGEVSEKIEMNTSSKIATMTLSATNNTESECSDMVLLGRVPTKDAIDVITKEELGTTIDTKMVSAIEGIDVLSNTKIYYSNNAKATNDLENLENEWKEIPENLSEVKSYLIVIEDSIEPGEVLKFKYDFEIPEKLQFETTIYGTFGVFYNKLTEIATIYEGVKADKVGLKTDAGPKIEATLEVDVGHGTEIEECRFLNYTLKVTNTGSVKAEKVVVKNPIPKYARLYEYTSDLGKGNNSYIPADTSKDTIVYNIETLEPGETKTFNYMLKAKEIPGMDEYYGNKIFEDENGFYYEKYKDGVLEFEEGTEAKEPEKTKEYVNPNYEIYVENKAIIEAGNLNINTESNVVKNKIKDGLFDIEVTKNCMDDLKVGESNSYILMAKNISGKDLTDVVLETTLPENVKPTEPSVILMNHGLDVNEFGDFISVPFDTKNITFDEASGKYQINLSEIYDEEIINVYLNFDVIKGDLKEKDMTFKFITKEKTEESSKLTILFKGPNLEVNQTTNIVGNKVLEDETIELLISIKNIGNGDAENVKIYDEIPKCINVHKVELSGDASDIYSIGPDNILDVEINSLVAFGEVALKISGTIGDLDEDLEFENFAKISANYNKDLLTNEIALIAENVEEKPATENDGDISDSQGTNNGSQNTGNEENNDGTIENGDGNNSNNNQSDGSDISSENNNNTNNNNINSNDNNDNNNNSNNSNANSNNNSNNSNNGNNNNVNNNNDSNNKETETAKKYKISGVVWLDQNKNGSKDENEKTISSIKVQLLKAGKVEKTIITNGNGKYEFTDLLKGNYSIAFLYDGDVYYSTVYKRSSEDLSSNAISDAQGRSITNNITINNSDIENINLGLVKKERFDFTIEKEIVSATIETSKRNETKTFEDGKLGKIEIKAKEVKGALVELTYKITVRNNGDIAGCVEQIADSLPKDTILVEDKNTGWYMGKDGKAYYDGIKDKEIQPGEEKVINITIQKQLTEDNIGVLLNKASILKTTNKSGATENKEGNDSTQEMLILVSTGKVTQAIVIIIPIILAVIAIIKRDSIIDIIGNKKKTKKFYR